MTFASRHVPLSRILGIHMRKIPVLGCQKRLWSTCSVKMTRHGLLLTQSKSLLSHTEWNKSVVLCYPIQKRSKSSASSNAQVTESQFLPEPPSTESFPNLPEPPTLPEPLIPELNVLGEVPLESLGLGGWTPPGLVQWALESLHVGLDLPWWTAIVIGTVVVRTFMFPLVVLAQRNTANMHNHMPTVQRLQQRLTDARVQGNVLNAARYANEMMDYMRRNKVNPLKSMMVPMAQVPVFLSVFIGLRRMANLPVESMQTGGMLWFTDLTLADPYYILPLVTAATLWATIEVGTDAVRADSMSQNMKMVMRIFPLMVLPVTLNFPTAMLCYWFTSNAFSLIQVAIMRIPTIRNLLKIPEMVKHVETEEQKEKKKKGFMQGFKESMNNSKMISQLEQRQRRDDIAFREAGIGPIQKTYKYDPTKVKPKSAVSAKEKS